MHGNTMKAKIKIVALAVFHNRKEMTLKAVKSILDQLLPEGVSVDIVLVDDGSTDGTADAIKNRFPGVKIINGDGNLYWNQGMIYGWKNISDIGFDYLMPFNDDIILNKNAIHELLSCIMGSTNPLTIVSGAMFDPIQSVTSYGGKVRNSKIFPLRFRTVKPEEGHCKIVDAINMNCILIPKNVLNKIGFLSNRFKHSCGDYEYGIRHIQNGGSLLLSSGHIGVCLLHKPLTFVEKFSLFRKLAHYRKNYPFYERLYYFRVYGGNFWVFGLLLFYISKLIRIKK
jgi:GT2 family glycosyltransferase